HWCPQSPGIPAMINKKRLVTLTQKVIQIDSQNPPGNEMAIADFIRKDLSGFKVDIKTHTFKKHRPNLIVTLKGSLPRKQAAKAAILITPHYDTVPIGKGWTYPPHGGRIDQ